MRWLGLDWDEGPEIGGPHAPYRQSERSDLYTDALAKLAASSYTYDCFCTTEEVDARRKASGSKVMGYDGFCRDLDPAQRAAWEAEGRKPVVRFRMPDGSITWQDLVRGEVTFETQYVPDFALCRANGDPLYTLVNPVDDALMEITHVLRGEDLLSSTPRQIPLHAALIELGIGTVMPEFGHLPFVMGEGNKKLSKRDPEAHALAYRDQGFLPEGMLNYLALLGWAIAGGPRHLLARGDGRGLRHQGRQPQPGALRHQEGRRDQHRPDAAAVGRGDHPPRAAVPQGGRRRRPTRSATPTPSCSSWRCRWSPSGSTSSPRPSTCSASSSSTRRPSPATRPTSRSC